MFCVQCGSAIPAEDKFCRSCGAPVYRAAGSAPEVQLASAVPVPQGAVQTAPVYPGVPASIYPGGVPQQPVYYVVQQPAAHTHTLQQMNLLRSLQGRIQSLASTEKLEGFSLKEMFSDVFKKRSAEQVEEYPWSWAARRRRP